MSFEILKSLAFWHWLALGAVLMILEVMAPGVIFLWLGVAAMLTGALLWAVPNLPVEIQFIVFAVLSVVSVIIGRLIVGSRARESDHPELNQRGQQHVGAMYMLEDATVNGHGKVRVDDSLWAVEVGEGEKELPKGELVQVLDVKGSTLIIRSATDTTWREGIDYENL